jgi:ABC-type multidrug transport system ATPase subunit
MLEIKNLRKVYSSSKDEKVAVDGISLTVERGAFFGLLGPNGAGKSIVLLALLSRHPDRFLLMVWMS